jgi:hypothetical protein
VRFPRSLRFDQRAWRPALPLRPRHGYAIDLHRDLPGQTCETLPGGPPTKTSTKVRTAHQPTSTGLELARFQEALQHRFLTYTVPSCSPSPAPPAVPNRLDFVAAAPPSPTSPESGCRQLHRPATTGQPQSPLTSARNHSASWRTPINRTDPWVMRSSRRAADLAALCWLRDTNVTNLPGMPL